MLYVHPAVISGYGLIEAPIDRVLSTFGTHHRADQAVMSVRNPHADAAGTLDYLDLRTYGATRLALLDFGDWTVVLTNLKTGSDFADYQYWAGRTVGARTVRVVDSAARWRRDCDRRVRLSWEMRSFEFHRADNQPIRIISNANDGGRWTFFASGDPLPFESGAPYEADNKRDRFSSQELHAVLEGLGPGHLTAEKFLATPRFALLSERKTNAEWQARIDAAARTIASDEAEAR